MMLPLQMLTCHGHADDILHTACVCLLEPVNASVEKTSTADCTFVRMPAAAG